MGIHTTGTYVVTNDDGSAADPTGTFVLGIDLESYSGKSGDLIAGIDTRASQLSFQATLSGIVGAGGVASPVFQQDFYMHYDCQLVFADGGMTIMF